MTGCHGLGPMPGADPAAAAGIIAGESAGVVHRPVQPARGLGADPGGRTGALAADLVLDRGIRGWRVAAGGGAGHPPRAAVRARDLLEAEADGCEAAWGTAPERVRLSALGPLSLATAVEDAAGHRLLADRGARAWLAESLAEGLAAAAADIRRRHGSAVAVQLDEPGIGAALGGLVPDAAGWGRLEPVPAREAAALLRRLIGRLAAAEVPVTLRPGAAPVAGPAGPGAAALPAAVVAESGAAALWVRADRLRGTAALDGVGSLIAGGVHLELGCGPAAPGARDAITGAWAAPDERAIAEGVARLWDELGFPRAQLVDRVALTPEAGFAGVDAAWPARALGAVRRAADLVTRAAGDL